MNFEQLVESRIQEAMAEGLFNNLEGQGRPLRLDPLEHLAGRNWLGYHVLSQANVLPPWLHLGQEIERKERAVGHIRESIRDRIDEGARSGRWDLVRERLRLLLHDFRDEGRALRRMQDQFNVDAPGAATQRAGIWVDYELDRFAGGFNRMAHLAHSSRIVV